MVAAGTRLIPIARAVPLDPIDPIDPLDLTLPRVPPVQPLLSTAQVPHPNKYPQRAVPVPKVPTAKSSSAFSLAMCNPWVLPSASSAFLSHWFSTTRGLPAMTVIYSDSLDYPVLYFLINCSKMS